MFLFSGDLLLVLVFFFFFKKLLVLVFEMNEMEERIMSEKLELWYIYLRRSEELKERELNELCKSLTE